MINPIATYAANALGASVPGVNKRKDFDALPRVSGPTAKATTMSSPGLADSGVTPEEIQATSAWSTTEDENSIQSMFDKRKAAMEQRRALNTTTAKSAALGNVLRSLVQPLGWAVGGSVAPVIPYDSRQYIDAYNRALQYDNNVINAGTQEMEYQIRSAEREANRDLQRDLYQMRSEADERKLERQNELKLGQIEAQAKAQQEVARTKGEIQKEIEALKGKYRVSRGGLSVSDRALISARNQYEQYKRSRIQQGLDYMPFEQYLKGEGFDVKPNGSGNTGKGDGRSNAGLRGGNDGRESAGLR